MVEALAELLGAPRPEFVASLDSLPVTVISTVELINWWRAGDWTAIRAAVLGDATATAQSATPVNPPQPPSAKRRRWWSGGWHQ